MSLFKLAATDIAAAIVTFFKAKRVPYFVGRPGCGKTAMVREGAKEIARLVNAPVAVREQHLASMSEVDIRGYLIPQGDQANFTKPEFWSTVEQHPYGILFLDEFAQASHEMQKAVAPLLLDRRIGEYVLPDGWMVVCAGNRLEDNAGANSILSHVINRITMFNVEAPDVDEWVGWAVGAGMPPELIAMAKLRPDVVFHAEIPDVADTPYCTPRSIEIVGDLANNYPGGITQMVAEPIGMCMLAGAVGDGAASEIAGMVRTTLRLPSFEQAMNAPETTVVPSDLAEAYAMVMLVAVRADGDKHRETAAQYLTRFPVNIALTGIVALIRREKKFLHSKQFGKWVADNRSMVHKFQKYITLGG